TERTAPGFDRRAAGDCGGKSYGKYAGTQRGGRSKQSARSGHFAPSRNGLAKIFKVGHNAIQQAKALLTESPDPSANVDGCTSSLAFAYEQLQQRRQQAAQRCKDAERVAEYTDAISNGEMTMEDALQKAIEREREEKAAGEAQADARRNWLK